MKTALGLSRLLGCCGGIVSMMLYAFIYVHPEEIFYKSKKLSKSISIAKLSSMNFSLNIFYDKIFATMKSFHLAREMG